MFLTVPLPGRDRSTTMIKEAVYSALSSAYTAAYYAAFHALAISDALYCFTQVCPWEEQTDQNDLPHICNASALRVHSVLVCCGGRTTHFTCLRRNTLLACLVRQNDTK